MKALIEEQYLKTSVKESIEDFKNKQGEYHLNLKLNSTFLASMNVPGITLGKDLVYDVSYVITDHDFDVVAYQSVDGEKIKLLETIKNDQTYALTIPNMIDEYIAMNDQDTDRVLEKLGISFFKHGTEDEDNQAFWKQGKKLAEKYAQIALKEVENKITVQNNQTLEIHGTEKGVTLYELSLANQDVQNMKRKMFESLKADDEALWFITKAVQKAYGVTLEEDEEKEYFTDLKNSAVDAYKANLKEVQNPEEVVYCIKLYSDNHQTIKTVLESYVKETFIIEMETIDQYANVTLSGTSTTSLSFRYNGKEEGNNYEGKLDVWATILPVNVFELKIKEVENSQKEIRKIDTLDAFLLNEASDEELEEFREKLEENIIKIQEIQVEEAEEYEEEDEGAEKEELETTEEQETAEKLETEEKETPEEETMEE